MQTDMRRRAVLVIASIIICLLACLVIMSGFSNNTKSKAGTADNEVLTFKPVPKNKMLITIRAEYDVDYDHMEAALEKKFPDVDVVFVLHWTSDTPYELQQSLIGGNAEDIIISAFMPAVNKIAPKYLIDLSASELTSKYRMSALNDCQYDGRLYYLPGPSDMISLIYNRTMFEQHGWKAPHSRSGFFDLCKKINASGIRALQPACVNPPDAQTLFTSFIYRDLFAGLDNYKWLINYQQGRTSMSGHMEPAFDNLSFLKSYGLIRSSDFDIRRANRSKMEYNDDKCAMIIETQMAEAYSKLYGSKNEFAMMPFWNGNDENSGYLVIKKNYYIGLNADLKHPENQKKLAKIIDIMKYISTPEGQRAISGGTIKTIPSVKGIKTDINSFNEGAKTAIVRETLAPYVNFMRSGTYNPVQIALRDGMRKYVEGKSSAKAVMLACDMARDRALRYGVERGDVIGQAKSNFTKLETGLFIADAFRNMTKAEIGLCLVGKINYGTVARIYSGDITEKDISMLTLMLEKKPQYPNDKKLGVVLMTGRQIMALLKKPYTEKNPESFRNVPYFTASGLRITFAPWANPDKKLKAVTLSDGSPLKPDKQYKVALWYWPFDAKCPYKTLKIYDISCDEILTEAVKKAGTIQPFSDGRFTLDWGK